MKSEEFNQLVKNRFEACKNLLEEKGKIYGREDRLINFKRQSGMKDECAEKALLGNCSKQITTIVEFINDLNLIYKGDMSVPIPSFNLWIEYIRDVINYMVLLEGLLTERYGYGFKIPIQQSSDCGMKELAEALGCDPSFQFNTRSKTNETPWGSYTTLAWTTKWKVKILVIKPKQRTSLQSHKYRGEYLDVLSGTGTFIYGPVMKTISCTQNTIHIPIMEKHRIINNQDIPLIILERSFGNILSEDDIIRYEDDYGRECNEQNK